MLLVILKIMLMGISVAGELNKTSFTRKSLFPMIHNLPIGLIKNSSINPILSLTCVRWFMYDWQAGADNDMGKSVIDKITNDAMREYCPEVKRSVPYFERNKSGSFNSYINQNILTANNKTLKPGMELDGRL